MANLVAGWQLKAHRKGCVVNSASPRSGRSTVKMHFTLDTTTSDDLAARLDRLISAGKFPKFEDKVRQLGSYGGGNHLGECEAVQIADNYRARRAAEVFGLRDGCVAFLSHCGSRGFGYALANDQFRTLQEKFAAWSIPLPGEDRELVYAPLGTTEA